MTSSMDISRRTFLLQGSALLAAAAFPTAYVFSQTSKEYLLGGCRYKDNDTNVINFSLVRFTPQSNDITQAPSTFFPHSIAFTDSTFKKAYAFEKIGPGAGLFDLEKMTCETIIPPVSGRLFYGHGTCSRDGKLLYTTETSVDGSGAIGIRETGSLKYVGDFPTYGQHPHDCHILENGSVLAVTNGGGNMASGQRASICYIDIASKKLLKRVEMPDERFNAGHIFPLQDRTAILVSAPRRDLDERHLGAVSIQSDALTVLTSPTDITSKLFGEALSVVAIPTADLFAATHPTAGMVTFWKLSTHQFIKALDLPHARGVALTRDKQSLWVTYGKEAGLAQIGLNALSIQKRVESTMITGSHLFTV